MTVCNQINQVKSTETKTQKYSDSRIYSNAPTKSGATRISQSKTKILLEIKLSQRYILESLYYFLLSMGLITGNNDLPIQRQHEQMSQWRTSIVSVNRDAKKLIKKKQSFFGKKHLL